MSPLLSLDHIVSRDAPRVGGKAANCARLKQEGFPVPEGVALPAEAMDSPAALGELKAWLARLSADARLAVRSSATDEDSAGHSFAGIHETKLNVSPAGVPEALRACWDSVRSPRALAYRRAVGLPTDGVGAAVLVQLMVQPAISGVAFTVDPVTGDNDLVINAAWGLGEALVSGQVEPDEFRVRRRGAQITTRRLGAKRYRAVAEGGVTRLVPTSEEERRQPCLADGQIRELTGLLVRLELQFGAPQDVEWCHDGRQFWILQSRPVTTRPPRAAPDIEWTRANVREVLPDLPAPQVLDAVCELLNSGSRSYYGPLAAPEAELGPPTKAFFGRVYFNLSQFRHICAMTRTPPALLLRGIGHSEAIRPEDEAVPRPSLGRFLRALPHLLRLLAVQLAMPWLFPRELARLREGFTRHSRAIATQPTEGELWRELTSWRQESDRTLKTIFALGGVGIYELPLQQLCRRVGFPAERLLLTHLAAGEKSVSAQQAFDLLALARRARNEATARDFFLRCPPVFERWRDALAGTVFLAEFDRYLAQYGHRGKYESDWSWPRYAEDPTPLLEALAHHVGAADCPDPETLRARQEVEAARSWADFQSHLGPWQRLWLRPLVHWLLGRIKWNYRSRELFRSELVRTGFALRRLHLVLAERFRARGWLDPRDDYFFLLAEEIGSALEGALPPEELRPRIAGRQAERAVWEQLEMPLLMRESELPALIRRANAVLPDAEVSLLPGLCISPGSAEGVAVVLRHPTDFARMKRGAILVAPATDPGWTPLFTLAGGVIVEVGGTLSHAATVAREYGLPALANVKDATRLLKDGDLVRVDATAGFVQVLARAGQGAPARRTASGR